MKNIQISVDVSSIAAALINNTGATGFVPPTRIMLHRESEGSVLIAVEPLGTEEMSMEQFRELVRRNQDSHRVPKSPCKPTGITMRGFFAS